MGRNASRVAGVAVLALGIAFLCSSQPAEAAHHSGGYVSVNVGGGGYGGYYAPAPVPERRWIPERYETRYETVLVEPEHHERRWVPAVLETRYDRHGRPYTVEVRCGRYESVCVPARYETRAVRVSVPGCYEDVPVARYERHRSRPRFSFGGFFGFR